MQKTLLAGIQPTNSLTLGNYLGSIKKIVDFQHKYNSIIFVADLHAQTLPLTYHKFDYSQLQSNCWEVIKTYVACGVDLSKTKIFLQSHISQHLQLFYFLLTHSSLGELKRMTQYKFLAQKLKEPNGSHAELMGLLCYPVLMSADILLYDVDLVAVGKDQEQHLELTSTLAKKINERYKAEVFKIPQKFEFESSECAEKIMDLQHPDKKMSKTAADHMGTIFLNDSPEAIKEKVMKAKTDSLNQINLNKQEQPGIFNLLNIYAIIHSISIEESYQKFQSSSYFDLKNQLANDLATFLEKIQLKYKQVDIEQIKKEVLKHTETCKKLAQEKIQRVYENL